MSDKPKSPVGSRGGGPKGVRVTSADGAKNKGRLAALAPGENIKEKQVSAFVLMINKTFLLDVSPACHILFYLRIICTMADGSQK